MNTPGSTANRLQTMGDSVCGDHAGWDCRALEGIRVPLPGTRNSPPFPPTTLESDDPVARPALPSRLCRDDWAMLPWGSSVAIPRGGAGPRTPLPAVGPNSRWLVIVELREHVHVPRLHQLDSVSVTEHQTHGVRVHAMLGRTQTSELVGALVACPSRPTETPPLCFRPFQVGLDPTGTRSPSLPHSMRSDPQVLVAERRHPTGVQVWDTAHDEGAIGPHVSVPACTLQSRNECPDLGSLSCLARPMERTVAAKLRMAWNPQPPAGPPERRHCGMSGSSIRPGMDHIVGAVHDHPRTFWFWFWRPHGPAGWHGSVACRKEAVLP